MREVEAQREMIEAVREAGGAGTKLSNRFLVGVCDLLLKLPGYSAILIEAKLNEVGPRMTSVLVEPTSIQLRWLNDYHEAGMLTGIASFAIRRREFGVKLMPIVEFQHHSPVHVLTDAHAWCPMGPGFRKQLMREQLIAFLEEEGSNG